MNKNGFWKVVGIFFGAAVLVCAASGTTAFLLESRNSDLAAVNYAYDPSQDPFEQPLKTGTSTPTFSLGGALYRDALPVGYTNWEWEAASDWRSTAQRYDSAPYSLKANFLQPMSSVGMNGPSFSTKGYQSLLVAVYPSAPVGDVYLELYDAKGNSMGLQSLGWYAPGGALVPNQWQVVTIPLQNLMGSSTSQMVSGFALTGEKSGVAYFDAITLQKTAAAHAKWVMPAAAAWAPFNPLATSSVTNLPYTLQPTDDALSRWYDYYGTFAATSSGIMFGPFPGSSNSDALAIYRGGKNWEDYVVNATLNWGITTSFSLVVRFTDASDYAECAFSHYADTVQLYEVKGGNSTLLATSPTLPTRNVAPWSQVMVGAQVQGPELKCFVGGTVVLTEDMPDLSRAGTVGFEAWDSNSYASPHIITNFTVAPALHD